MRYSALPVVLLALAQGSCGTPVSEPEAGSSEAAPAPNPLAPPSAAPAPSNPFQGVWAGSLGGQQLRLCFDDIAITALDAGRLYVLGDPDIHRFSRNGAQYKETGDFSADDGTLRFEASGGGRLTLHREFGGKMADGELNAVAALDGGRGSCDSPEFLAPRLTDVKKQVQPRSLGGLRYSRYSFDPGPGFRKVLLAGIALDGSQPGDARINARLQANATQWGWGDDYLSCSLHYRGDIQGFEFKQDQKVIYLSKALVSIRFEYDGGCGGIHDFGTVYGVFDRTTGKSADATAWLAPGAGKLDKDAINYRAPFTPGPALHRILLTRASMNAESKFEFDDLDNCYETGLDRWSCAFSVFLHRDGIGFVRYQDGVPMMPRGTLIVPWTRIKPFLTPKAWAMLNSGN